jgi:Trypsin-co-occurring domain 2
MRSRSLIWLAALGCFAPTFACAQAATDVPSGRASTTNSAPFGITQVLEQVKREIRAAQSEGFESGLRLRIEKVTLTMKLVEVDTLEGRVGAKFAVAGAELGGTGSMTSTGTLGRSITLDLKPSSELLTGGAETIGLAEAIREVKEAVRKAVKSPPRFDLQRFVFSFDFEVRRDIDGSMEFVVFETGGASGRHSGHKLSVEFAEARF